MQLFVSSYLELASWLTNKWFFGLRWVLLMDMHIKMTRKGKKKIGKKITVIELLNSAHCCT